jgi:hypothetical protein
MGKEKLSDTTSIPDAAMGITEVTAYDPDSNTKGTGVAWNSKEAAERAHEDLEAQKIADQAEQKIEDKKND